MSKSESKLRLIDILNKIANGELKEGTKLKVLRDSDEYLLTEYRGLIDEYGKDIFEIYNLKALNEEVELIEPNDFGGADKMAETNQFREDTKMIEPTECEHEWKRYSLGRLGQRTENHRYCSKCGADEIETTDNTKIEELDLEYIYWHGFKENIEQIACKLNEVIRYINK